MALSYTRDIRPLFRSRDISCMQDFGFDLGKLSDVRMRSADIYARLAAKSMPEDGPWPDDKIALFKQWMDEGMPE
jgi:hypothetical protein